MIVKKITLKSNYYLVLFENNESYKLHEQVIIKYGIFKPNTIIEDDKFLKLLADNDYYMAITKGMNYLTVIHSKKEVYEYLLKYFSVEASKKALEHLVSLNLINDTLYADILLDYVKRNNKGYNYYIKELKKQEISNDVVDNVKENYTIDEENEICLKALNKQLPNIKKVSINKAKEKLYNFLLSRGFRDSSISYAIDNSSDLLVQKIDMTEALKKSYDGAYKKYSKKYEGYVLKEHLMKKLLSEGFTYSDIKNLLEMSDA